MHRQEQSDQVATEARWWMRGSTDKRLADKQPILGFRLSRLARVEIFGYNRSSSHMAQAAISTVGRRYLLSAVFVLLVEDRLMFKQR